VLRLLTEFRNIMPDISRRFKKARDELSKFQQKFRSKRLEREKLAEEIELAEGKIREIRRLERELRLKRSLLGRIDIELRRLSLDKKRLDREIPHIEREFQRMERERRFGRSI